MYMKLSVPKLKRQRESRAWSQSHLAEVADISLRTIQRIENSGSASPESVKAICSAYEIAVDEILESSSDEVIIKSILDRLKKVTFNIKVIIPSIIAFAVAFLVSFLLTK